MSQFLYHHDDNNNNADIKAIAIPRIFSENSQAKNVVTSIFSYSHNVFKSLLFQGRLMSGLY